jgi:dienelactone hydrolase
MRRRRAIDTGGQQMMRLRSAFTLLWLAALLGACGPAATPPAASPAPIGATVAAAVAGAATMQAAPVASAVARGPVASPGSPAAGAAAQLPDLTGPYQVGTVVRQLVDRARPDPYADDPTLRRELLVQLWYPARPQPGALPALYWPDVDLTGFSPADVSRQDLKRLRAHAFPGAAFVDAPTPFPVVTLSHGDSGTRVQYSALAEELASHGYVVVGIDHPYTSVGTRFPDGRVLRFETIAGSANDGAATVTYPDGRVARFARIRTTDAERVRVRGEDVRFVLDQLAQLNGGDPEGTLTGRLDLARVGVMGHSFGGSTAAQACWLDRRCTAGLNLDGPLVGDVAAAGLDQPFMIMNNAQEGLFGSRGLFFARQLRGDGYMVAIAGTVHNSFSDLPLYPRTGPLGAIAPRRGYQVITTYMVAFFDRYLKDQPSPLLDGPSPAYPEVQIALHRP